MASVLVIAEKPSVARDIAKVIGADRAGDGFREGNGYTVTWAIGHLVTLSSPQEMNPEWKAWRREALPLLPKTWRLQVIPQTRSQFEVVERCIQRCSSIICATDAGREGELIFRYIYEAVGCIKPVRRLWISSLTVDSIEKGFQNLREGKSMDSLAAAARARSCADWLIGMNLSRAYALTYNEKFFVGRVQTPTLAMIVKRDLEIQNFKSEDYYEIWANFDLLKGSSESVRYEGYYIGEESGDSHLKNSQAKRLPADLNKVEALLERIRSGVARVRSVDPKTVHQAPPLLYDLTELQRHANRVYGYSASKTLEYAQVLYEKYKLISYPRTGSRYLSRSVAETLPEIVRKISGPYLDLIDAETGEKLLGSRFVNDAEVTDHHAIIPTGLSLDRVALKSEEKKIYDLICRRILAVYQQDYVTSITTALTEVEEKEKSGAFYLFRSEGLVVEQLGWKRLEVGGWEAKSAFGKSLKEDRTLPSELKKGALIQIGNLRADLKKTKAPPHLTEGILLTAMETAGRTLEDRDLAAVIQDSGLGTPATRAGIIETLLAREYIERRGKTLVSTPLGLRLIQTVDASVKSPELTAKWERELSQIQQGKRTFDSFIVELEASLKKTVGQVLEKSSFSTSGSTSARTSARTSWRPAFAEPLSAAPSTDSSPSGEDKRSSESNQGMNQRKAAEEILKSLSKRGSCAAGRLFEELQSHGTSLDRNDFEQALEVLTFSGEVKIYQDTFEADGKKVSYRRVVLASTR